MSGGIIGKEERYRLAVARAQAAEARALTAERRAHAAETAVMKAHDLLTERRAILMDRIARLDKRLPERAGYVAELVRIDDAFRANTDAWWKDLLSKARALLRDYGAPALAVKPDSLGWDAAQPWRELAAAVIKLTPEEGF